MTKPLHIVGINGSLRKNSFNKQLLDLASAQLPEGVAYTFADYSDLPLFNEDLENPTPESVLRFKQQIELADGLIFTAPNYNNSIPGVLKNAIDWASRGGNSFNGKVAAIVGTTPSLTGTITAQEDLRAILNFVNVTVVGQPRVLVSAVHTKLDEAGKLKLDQGGQEILEKLVKRFVELTGALKQG